MKRRVISAFLLIVTAFSLIACDNEQAEKYCFNCGKGISNNHTFCSYCGIALNQTMPTTNTTEVDSTPVPTSAPVITNTPVTTSVSVSTNTPIPTIVPTPTNTPIPTIVPTPTNTPIPTIVPTPTNTPIPTIVPTPTNTPVQTSAPVHTHTYTKFICYPCGAVDLDNAYDYLIQYVKLNGKVSGSYVSITLKEDSNRKYELKYDAQNQILWASMIYYSSKSTTITVLELETGYYGLNYVYDSSITNDLAGYIDPKTFNENSPMTYGLYTGDDSVKASLLDAARLGLTMLLLEMEGFFDTNDVDLKIYSLEYMGMQ